MLVFEVILVFVFTSSNTLLGVTNIINVKRGKGERTKTEPRPALLPNQGYDSQRRLQGF